MLKSLLIFSFIFSFQASAIEFKKGRIKIKKHILKVEIADTEATRQRGLMYRTELKDGHGMLFIFPYEQPLNFWMKNTFIPLSLAFFNNNKILLETYDMVPMKTIMQKNVNIYNSSSPARYALEVPLGWFKKNHIKKNDRFIILNLE